MVKKSISEFGQTVSVVDIPKKVYGNLHIELRNPKGEYVGNLALNGRGQVTLVSLEGYELTNSQEQ
jgi:hypothetical protein